MGRREEEEGEGDEEEGKGEQGVGETEEGINAGIQEAGSIGSYRCGSQTRKSNIQQTMKIKTEIGWSTEDSFSRCFLYLRPRMKRADLSLEGEGVHM